MGVKAQAAAHKETGTSLDALVTEQQFGYAGTAPQAADVEDAGLPGFETAVEEQENEDNAGQEDVDTDEQPQQQVENVYEQLEQQVTETQKQPEEGIPAEGTEQVSWILAHRHLVYCHLDMQ